MGGSRKTETKTDQVQNSTTTLGSTSNARGFLDEYQTAAQNAANMGSYQGDVVAGPTQIDQYSPILGDVSGHIAGADPMSRDWIKNNGGMVQDTAKNMGQYWNDVSAGKYLDPNQNTALQSYLANMSEGTRDEFDRAAGNFKSQAIDSGAFGGTGYGRGMTWALDELTQNDLAARSSVLYKNYQDEMARRERSTEGANSAFDLGLVPGEASRYFNQLDLDNEKAAAQWKATQDQGKIQDDWMRAQVDQAIRQAGLTNDAARWDSAKNSDMAVWERYFQGLSNPVFGQSSHGTMSGTQTTTSKNPLWQDILGAASSIGQTVAGLNGMGGGGGTNIAAPMAQAQPMTPMQFQQLMSVNTAPDYSQLFGKYGKVGP